VIRFLRIPEDPLQGQTKTFGIGHSLIVEAIHLFIQGYWNKEEWRNGNVMYREAPV
jgi:hypothetical protein